MFLTCCCAEDVEPPMLLNVATTFDPSPELESLARIEKAADRSVDNLIKGPALPTVPEASSAEGAISVTIKVPHKAGVGLALDFAEGPHLRICGIVPNGPIAKYNSGVAADLQVHPGDFLVQAKRCADEEGPAASSSAKSGPQAQDSVAASIVALVQMGGQLELLIRRPFTYKVNGIARGGKGLGLDLSYHAQGTAVAVLAILDGGAIADYNATVGSSSPGAVQVGDYILEANGESGRIDPLLQGLGADTVNLVMARPK